MHRILSPLAICFALGACVAPNMAGVSPSAFDGTYNGTITMTHANPGSMQAGGMCAAPGTKDGSLMVQNGRVVWLNGGSNIYAPISSDGAFVGQNGGTFLAGKITSSAMVARGNIGACHTIYDLTKAA